MNRSISSSKTDAVLQYEIILAWQRFLADILPYNYFLLDDQEIYEDI